MCFDAISIFCIFAATPDVVVQGASPEKVDLGDKQVLLGPEQTVMGTSIPFTEEVVVDEERALAMDILSTPIKEHNPRKYYTILNTWIMVLYVKMKKLN